MTDERMDPMIDLVRETYHVPGETPQEAMWTAIEAQMSSDVGAEVVGGDVVDLASERRRRNTGRHVFRGADRSMGWAVAAAAVMVLGIGIGRMTAPLGDGGEPEVGVATTFDGVSEGALTLAAQEHFGRTESLLTMLRADARSGSIDPATAQWATGLLSETRLLLDADRAGEPAVDELLLDLELLLIQIVGVAETGSMDEAQARTELEIALRTLDDGEVLPRIQAALPGLSGV